MRCGMFTEMQFKPIDALISEVSDDSEVTRRPITPCKLILLQILLVTCGRFAIFFGALDIATVKSVDVFFFFF